MVFFSSYSSIGVNGLSIYSSNYCLSKELFKACIVDFDIASSSKNSLVSLLSVGNYNLFINIYQSFPIDDSISIISSREFSSYY